MLRILVPVIVVLIAVAALQRSSHAITDAMRSVDQGLKNASPPPTTTDPRHARAQELVSEADKSLRAALPHATPTRIRLTDRYVRLVVRYQAALSPGQPEALLSRMEAVAYQWRCRSCVAVLEHGLAHIRGTG